MTMARTSDVWWKNAIFYCLDVETFQDGDGDGIGDFQGLTERIDYLAGLGVDCIWLMPFYPSPNLDDGYDITEYYAVDRRLGDLGDLGEFVEFVRTARDRGIRVIADLVVNHTSDQHPWFQEARADRNSPYRDFYVWQDEPPEDGPEGLIFPGQQEEIWTHDEQTGQYYLHRFYAHQPDLNIANPKVRREIEKIVGFWLELGLSGFRVDAVNFLIELDGIADPGDLDPHGFLRDLRAFLNRRRGHAMMLGEVNLDPKGVRDFFGDEDGDELHMCLNFNLNQAVALALVRGRAEPVVTCLKSLLPLAPDDQWGNFVRNHDEWSLDKLSEAERQEVFEAFGPDPDMQLFGRGLRRRLPTMLNGDQARIRMTYALTFGLPGAPVLFYGEEIGMAENLEMEGRQSVRAPMQWSNEENGGFSTAAPEDVRRPLVKGAYGPEHVNVADQEKDEDSLLNWIERLIRSRKTAPEIGHGDWQILDTGQPSVLALRYDWEKRIVLVFHNLAAEPCTVRTGPGDTTDWQGLVQLHGQSGFRLDGGEVEVELDGYGSCWLRVRLKDEPIRR
jgi:trehalose synthase